MTINRDILVDLYNRIPETHQTIRDALLKAARYAISNPSLSLKKCNIALSIIVRDLYEKAKVEKELDFNAQKVKAPKPKKDKRIKRPVKKNKK